jgi:hypothetical protein
MGPYKENHATAATFAFRKELLRETRFDETSAVAEEKAFLKNYTIPLLQLDTQKTILVFSHIHNSFDKREMLEQGENAFLKLSSKKVEDYIQDSRIYSFFLNKIDDILSQYEAGHPKYKPDVIQQTFAMREDREMRKKQYEEKREAKIEIQEKMILSITKENILLKEKVTYLENKIKKIVDDRIQEKMIEKKI